VIKLFHINDYVVDTSKYDSHLHGKVVTDFEEKFCEYVGAKYACSFSSATSAIFLAFLGKNEIVQVPSMIPPVVLNALINSGNSFSLTDNVDWVGNSYLLHSFSDYKIIDSAQRVSKNQFRDEADDQDLMIFSFYPTKPVGGIDGGIIVSNDREKIEWLKCAALNGMTFDKDNWNRKIIFPGWKMYLNSFQADIAFRNLEKLDEKKESLSRAREVYNRSFGYSNTSDHLYRVCVSNRKEFQEKLKISGIETGIHYHATHTNPVYSVHNRSSSSFEKTNYFSEKTVSIPFNENLSSKEIAHVIETILRSGYLLEEK